MSGAIITVKGLGKRYSLRAVVPYGPEAIRHERERYTALRDVLARRAPAPLRALKSKLESRKEKTGNDAENLTSNLRCPTFRRGVGHSGPEADVSVSASQRFPLFARRLLGFAHFLEWNARLRT